MDDQQSQQQQQRGPNLSDARRDYKRIQQILKIGRFATGAGGLGWTIAAVLVVVVVFTLFQSGLGEAAPIPTTGSAALPSLPPGNSPALTQQTIISALSSNPNNISVYKTASSITGVPWQVLAGIHYEEGRLGPNQSLVSGRAIGTNEPDVPSCSSQYSGQGVPIPLSGGGCGFASLLDSAIYAGRHLKADVGGGSLSSFSNIVTALSRYNGGGNRNCGKTPYTGCPPQYEGEDDPYALAYYDDRHQNMYLVYCADLTPCATPQSFASFGVMTAVRIVTDNFK